MAHEQKRYRVDRNEGKFIEFRNCVRHRRLSPFVTVLTYPLHRL